MTYYLTALTNDKARLIEKEMRTNCSLTADMIADLWEDLGFIVIRREEF